MGGRIRHEKQKLWVSKQQYMKYPAKGKDLEMRKNVLHQTKVGSRESNGQDWTNALELYSKINFKFLSSEFAETISSFRLGLSIDTKINAQSILLMHN